MSGYPVLRGEEAALRQRLIEMRRCVAEQEVCDSACPLLSSQLTAMEVFAEKLLQHVCRLRGMTEP